MELFDRTTAPVGADAWFVYALVDSRDVEAIRYIGITNAPRRRLSHHYSPALDGHTRKARWVAKVLCAGGSVQMYFLGSGLSQDDAKASEVRLIAEHKSPLLTNLTAGGDGAVGWVPSAEVREKIAATRRGKVLSAETREKLRVANTGRKSPNKGRILPPEWRANISAGVHRKMSDPSARRQISEAVQKRYADPVERERTGVLSRMAGPRSTSKSGFKGVSPNTRTGKWVAQIRANNQHEFLGYFPTPEAAANAYDQAAFAAWGADCYLNFPAEMAA